MHCLFKPTNRGGVYGLACFCGPPEPPQESPVLLQCNSACDWLGLVIRAHWQSVPLGCTLQQDPQAVYTTCSVCCCVIALAGFVNAHLLLVLSECLCVGCLIYLPVFAFPVVGVKTIVCVCLPPQQCMKLQHTSLLQRGCCQRALILIASTRCNCAHTDSSFARIQPSHMQKLVQLKQSSV